jgi:hypothetical protein
MAGPDAHAASAAAPLDSESSLSTPASTIP